SSKRCSRDTPRFHGQLGRSLASKAQIGSGASPVAGPRVGAWPAPSGRGRAPGDPGPAWRERTWMARVVAAPAYGLVARAGQSRPGLEVPACCPHRSGSLREAPSCWRTRFEMKELPVRRFASKAAWETWLEKHHGSSPGLWLEFAKKGSRVVSLSRAEALEVALCYGWIDGQAAPVDAGQFRQRFTPRRPRSKWSQINCT